MAAGLLQEYCNYDERSTKTANERLLLAAGVRNLNAFASFVSNHFLQGMMRRPQSSQRKRKAVEKINLSHLEEDESIGEFEQFPFAACRKIDSDEPKSLKSPRRVLQSQIPNGTSQQLRMDLVLLSECASKDELQKSTWKGCCAENRAQIWRMLVGYEPLSFSDRKGVLAEKREEYREYLQLLHAPRGAISISASRDVQHHMDGTSRNDSEEKRTFSGCHGFRTLDSDEEQMNRISYSSFLAKTLRQIEMDLPRTHPDIPIFHVDEVRNAMRRILYVFGILNPNNNYVQGMNEILTPVLVVFFSDQLEASSEREVDNFLKRTSLRGSLTDQQLADAEADAFWTFTGIVSLIEDNFVNDHPGILRRVSRLEEIVRNVDPSLAEHLAKNGNEFIQFSFRWMNCLLMRELPFSLVVMLWDVLLAEDDGISDLQVYFCAAMLTRFSADLMGMDFEDSILFLQHLPTVGWDAGDIDALLSQALVWKNLLELKSLAKQSEYVAIARAPR